MRLANKPCTDFGKSVKTRLIELGRTQVWLIEELRKTLPGSYIDGSLLYKILVGDVVSGKAVEAIHMILKI